MMLVQKYEPAEVFPRQYLLEPRRTQIATLADYHRQESEQKQVQLRFRLHCLHRGHPL